MDINTARNWLQNEIKTHRLKTEILTLSGISSGDSLIAYIPSGVCLLRFSLTIPYGWSLSIENGIMSNTNEINELTYYLILIRQIGRKWDMYCIEQD